MAARASVSTKLNPLAVMLRWQQHVFALLCYHISRGVLGQLDWRACGH